MPPHGNPDMMASSPALMITIARSLSQIALAFVAFASLPGRSPAEIKEESADVAVISSANGGAAEKGGAISRRFRAAILAGLPKYDSATNKPSGKSPAASIVPLDAGADGGGIVRLPDYVVHAPRPRTIPEKEIMSRRATVEFAERRYISTLDHVLNDHPIPLVASTVQSRALAMLAEDERLQDMADLNRAARNSSVISRTSGTDLKRLADETFMRRSEAGVDLSVR